MAHFSAWKNYGGKPTPTHVVRLTETMLNEEHVQMKKMCHRFKVNKAGSQYSLELGILRLDSQKGISVWDSKLSGHIKN